MFSSFFPYTDINYYVYIASEKILGKHQKSWNLILPLAFTTDVVLDQLLHLSELQLLPL